jgi:CHAD domain-containing protein
MSMAEGKWITGLGGMTPLVDAARRVLTLRLEVVRDCLGLALTESDKDPEYVHQLRVATRRAGAAVEIFASCLPEEQYNAARKHLRSVRRAAGSARDWDVFVQALAEEKQKKKRTQRPAFDFLSGYALAERLRAQESLAEASPDFPFAFERLFADTIAALHKPGAGRTAQTLVELARPMLFTLLRDLTQAAGENLDDHAHLHRVRILGKRLRYAMEVFADCFAPEFRQELYPAVEQMQEVLGRANDSYVTIGRLSTLREKIRSAIPEDWKRLKPGIEGWLRYHSQRLTEQRDHFLKCWERWQNEGAQSTFLAVLQVPESAAS